MAKDKEEKPVEQKKKVERKGKKKHKNQPASQRWKKYKIEGDKVIRQKTCPRCGPGIFLMIAKDRIYCGKCRYTEFISKEKPKEEAKAEEKK